MGSKLIPRRLKVFCQDRNVLHDFYGRDIGYQVAPRTRHQVFCLLCSFFLLCCFVGAAAWRAPGGGKDDLRPDSSGADRQDLQDRGTVHGMVWYVTVWLRCGMV